MGTMKNDEFADPLTARLAETLRYVEHNALTDLRTLLAAPTDSSGYEAAATRLLTYAQDLEREGQRLRALGRTGLELHDSATARQMRMFEASND
jgi:hypothetical protein